MTHQLPPPSRESEVIPPESRCSSKQDGGNLLAIVCRCSYGLVQIPIDRSVHLFRRNGVSLVCDASRAHVGDRVLLHGQPWDAEKMRVVRTHRSR